MHDRHLTVMMFEYRLQAATASGAAVSRRKVNKERFLTNWTIETNCENRPVTGNARERAAEHSHKHSGSLPSAPVKTQRFDSVHPNRSAANYTTENGANHWERPPLCGQKLKRKLRKRREKQKRKEVRKKCYQYMGRGRVIEIGLCDEMG